MRRLIYAFVLLLPSLAFAQVPQMGGINFTDGAVIENGGAQWVRFNNQTQGISAVVFGKYAGVNLPDGQGMIAIGELAMASQTDGTGESIIISPWGAPYVTTMHATVGIGEHVLGTDPNATACTVVGADVLRDTVGCSGGTVFGSGAVIDGNFVDDTVIGSGNLHGTVANVVIGPGTPNVGDIITVNFTTNDTGGNVAGLPKTITYTVAAGDTTALKLEQSLHAAINANIASIIYTKPAIPNVPGRFVTPLSTTAGDASDALGNYYIAFHMDGTQTTGMQLVVAASCSGACPNAISAQGASAPLHNTLIGRGIMAGVEMQNPQYNSIVGHGAASSVTTASFNTTNGAFTAQNIASGNNNTFDGYKSGALVTTGSNNLCAGYNSCGATLTTGSNNIILATSAAAAYDVDTAARSNLIKIGGVLNFQNQSLNAPTVSACGTSPAADSAANNVTGTVTVGSGTPASCTITFASAYRVFNHCQVTPQVVNASFAYAYTLSAITVTGIGLTGKIDYWCSGN